MGYPGEPPRVSVRSDPGQRRPLNEDAWGAVDLGKYSAEVFARKGWLYLVADGMGGHAAGEVASRIAVETILEQYYAAKELDSEAALREAFAQANRLIREQSTNERAQAGMGTTAVAAVVFPDRVLVANVGDSRAYLIRDGEALQITRDHSWVAEQVAAGNLTEEEAEVHLYRNVITRCLGHQPDVEVDLFRVTLRPGDRLLLCSDGLSNMVNPREIAHLVGEYPPDVAVAALVDLANQRGGPDNITALLITPSVVLREEKEAEPVWVEEVPSSAEEVVPAAEEVVAKEIVAEEVVAAGEEVPAPAVQARRVPWIWLVVIGGGVLLTLAALVLPSNAPLHTLIATSTPTPTFTPTPTPTYTPTATPTATYTPTPTYTLTPTHTPTPTFTPTHTPTSTTTPTPRPSPTSTWTPTATWTPRPAATPTAVSAVGAEETAEVASVVTPTQSPASGGGPPCLPAALWAVSGVLIWRVRRE